MPEKSKYSNPYYVALALILVLNAVLKWRFFCGLSQADDFSYGVYSFSMFRIPMSWDMNMDFRVLRVTLLLPVAVLFRFLPPADVVAVLYPMAASFGSIILVYLIGKKLYGINAGVLAAFVLATFPCDVLYSTMLLPDSIVPFYLSLSVWAFLNADSDTGGRSKLWYLLAGFALFLAFTTRENSYYFLLFFLPFAFSRRRLKNGLYLMGIGFALPVILLYSVYYVKSGDFMFNLHLAEHYRDPLIKSGYIPKNSVNWFVMLYYMFPILFMKLTGRPVIMSSLFGLTFYVGIVCIIYTVLKALKKRDFRILIALWWFLIVYLFLEYGTISFTSYQMMKKLDRFLLTLTPAMALSFGVVLSDAWGLGSEKIKHLKKIKRRWIAAFLSSVVMCSMLYSSYMVISAQKSNIDNNLRKFRWGYFNVLENKPHKPVYNTGGWWNNKLSFYFLPDLHYAEMPWRHSAMLRDLKAVNNPSDLAGSYVIIDRSHFSGDNDLRIKHSYDDFGSYVKLPPGEWTLLGSEYNIEIYEVPDGWSYIEPDGKDLALKSLLRSINISDFMLFLNSLHPDFLSRLTEEQLGTLIQILVNEKNPTRVELLGKRLEYREYNGHWKIFFNLN